LNEIEPYYPVKETGRKKKTLLMMLRIYFLQQWYNLSDPGVEEAIYDRLSFQKFLGIDLLSEEVPDETTIYNGPRKLDKKRRVIKRCQSHENNPGKTSVEEEIGSRV
jgi:IS5 family transposase